MYSFRVPIAIGGCLPDTVEKSLTVSETPDERIWIQASGSLRDASRATFRGSGYPTRADAERRGTELCSALRLAALRTGMTLDFMERQSFSAMSDHALAVANAAAPPGFRVINERAGVHVHASKEELLTFTMSAVGSVVNPPTNVVHHFSDALNAAVPSNRVHLAFDLFSQSSRARGADALLLTLVSAVEALVVPRKVSTSERALIALLARQTEESTVIEDPDRRAVLANRVWALQNETVRAGAMRLVRRLEPREYAGTKPTKFFDRVYELRSRLSHGDDPSWRDVRGVSGELVRFTRDLIDMEFTSPNE